MAIAIVLLAVVVAFVDVRSIVSTTRGADLLLIAATLALVPINLLIEAIKWRLLLTASTVEMSLREAIGSVLAGYTLGFATPARFGEYAGRVFYAADRRKGMLLVLALLDRIYSVWVYTLAGVIVLWFQLEGPLPHPGGVWWFTLFIGVVLAVGLGIVILRPSTVQAAARSLLHRWKFRRWQRYFDSIGEIPGSVRLRVLMMSTLRYGVFCTQFVLLVLSFSPVSPLGALYSGAALVFFVKTLIPTISLFDLGVRESASVLFLGFFGVAPAAAFNASLLLFAVNLAVPAFLGVAFVPRIRWKRFGRSAGKTRAVELPAA